MNVKRNKERKEQVMDMIKEIAELQSQAPEKTAKKLDYILKGFLNDTLDFSNGIHYIDNMMKKTKSDGEKIFWIQVLVIIKKYFENL
jgi:hypothetical protein